MRIALALPVLLLTIVPCFADPQSRVRGISPKETRLIAELLARSETARALVAEIEGTDLIVYRPVQWRTARRPRRDPAGCRDVRASVPSRDPRRDDPPSRSRSAPRARTAARRRDWPRAHRARRCRDAAAVRSHRRRPQRPVRIRDHGRARNRRAGVAGDGKNDQELSRFQGSEVQGFMFIRSNEV